MAVSWPQKNVEAFRYSVCELKLSASSFPASHLLSFKVDADTFVKEDHAVLGETGACFLSSIPFLSNRHAACS